MTSNEIRETTDQAALKRVIHEDENPKTRNYAVRYLTDQSILTEIINGGDEYVFEVEEMFLGDASYFPELVNNPPKYTLDLRDTARERLAELQGK